VEIPFDQFEQHIHEVILKRGLSYFNKDRVQPPDELSPGFYEAIVEGSDNYLVRLKIQNEVITDYSCTCPYDYGPYCKHIVALLFYLQQDILDIEPKVVPSKKPKKKRKTAIDKLDGIFKEVPADTLVQYLKDKVMDTPSLRREFIATFAHYGKAESKSLYAQQLRAVIHSAKQRQGFIDYRGAFTVGKAAQKKLARASAHLEEGNFQSAFYITTAVLEVMTKALDYADDSNADIGEPVRCSMGLLYEIAAQELTEDLRKMIFDYALKTFKKKIFAGWDWHVDLLDLASLLLASEKEANILLELIDRNEGSLYDEESLQQIKYNILRMHGDNSAMQFLEDNIMNPAFREIALEEALKRNEFDKAISIAKDGIKCDEQEKPGLVHIWREWLLKIYLEMGENDKIVKIARSLYLSARDNKDWYYDTLKSNVAKDEWIDFVEDLISEIESREKWMDTLLLEKIFISEKYWDRLLQLLKDNVSLYKIREYEQYLIPDYTDELLALYENEIIKYLSNNTGRNYYQETCRYIRRMIKLGGKKEADNLIDYLKAEYPARRALREELEKV
jgi:hypothetical protein